MPSIRNRFYPLHDYSEHNVVNLYSLLTNSGLAGALVKISTGTANPANADGWSNTTVGTNIASTASFRYESKMKVLHTASGDTRFNALGLTLYSTLEQDENGILLKYNTPRAKEIGAVVSGEAVPIVTKGVFGIWGNYIDTSKGSVQPGNLVCVSRSGDGLLAAVDPTNSTTFNPSGVFVGGAEWRYEPKHVVGKWLTSLPTSSTTGVGADFSAQGGYALFQFNPSA
jgi:hypothetical protein